MSEAQKTPAKPKKVRDPRNGLRTSTTLATVLCIVGHIWLGFEQSWMDVVAALLTGYSTNILFEIIDAKANNRPLGFAGGGWKKVIDFLLSAHMTSITMSFILYTQDHWWALSFAVALAIGSKFLFRVKVDGRYRHFFNPSNFGIAAVLTIFPWASALPWMYTADVPGIGNILIPLLAVFLGSRLNILFTGRIPTILSFITAFVIQALGRAAILGTNPVTEVVPLTGFAMILFILYMITDPMTSPNRLRNQIIFGSSIAFVYGALLLMHVTYVLFYSVTIVAASRGLILFVASLRQESAARVAQAAKVTEMPAPAAAANSSARMSG